VLLCSSVLYEALAGNACVVLLYIFLLRPLE
jgi:hypothetical protein